MKPTDLDKAREMAKKWAGTYLGKTLNDLCEEVEQLRKTNKHLARIVERLGQVNVR